MTKIEEVARALWNAASVRAAGRPRLTEWADESEETREQWRHGARAAIAALREPTEAMLNAAEPCMDDYGSYGHREELAKAHTAMIDAILSEGE